MNNRGASLIEVIGVVIIIGIIGFIAIPSVSEHILNGKMTTFLAYENSMEDAAKNAVIDCIGNNSSKCVIPDKDSFSDIKLNTLIEEGFIDELNTPTSGRCDLEKSFVRVTSRGNLNYKFKVCLYCDNYSTKDDMCE